MRKSLLLFVFVSILVLVAGPYMPYWVLMIGVAVVSFFIEAGKMPTFISAGLSFGLTWLALTVYISIRTNSVLPKRMAELMGLDNDNLLFLGTGILGFLIGGFGGLVGTMVKKLLDRKY
ncbi:hypothetical protein [Aquiflexum gelatinilyticum]|uniref:Uncharacterized protein n=1 Tax=Aquiflexum gelatinilyticum TaxID=2961943 RepID=A0A9X2P3Z5_9BACT|nr:hypothetical protein [Aquiflexum gelatinilyticum]MCR9015458.1 hypothetical protein [Aquiflexum gelatinilyticum]MCS4433125.1 hypothetical protein [Aquiflexum gelatinilyticum]